MSDPVRNSFCISFFSYSQYLAQKKEVDEMRSKQRKLREDREVDHGVQYNYLISVFLEGCMPCSKIFHINDSGAANFTTTVRYRCFQISQKIKGLLVCHHWKCLWQNSTLLLKEGPTQACTFSFTWYFIFNIFNVNFSINLHFFIRRIKTVTAVPYF